MDFWNKMNSSELKVTLLSIGLEAGCSTEPVWMYGEQENLFPLYGNQTTIQPIAQHSTSGRTEQSFTEKT
jgi:hypothetical protein